MCKQLDMKLMELNQEAVFYHAAAQAKQQMIKRGTEAAYNLRIALSLAKKGKITTYKI